MKRKMILISLLGAIVAGVAYAGWWLGFRDGLTYAYSATGAELVSYHLAVKSGDTTTAAKVVETMTGDSVSMLLDGRHSFPLYGTFPYRSDTVLAMLRATWTPSTRRFGLSTRHPHRRPDEHDYADEFQKIEPAASVRMAARYEPPQPR